MSIRRWPNKMYGVVYCRPNSMASFAHPNPPQSPHSPSFSHFSIYNLWIYFIFAIRSDPNNINYFKAQYKIIVNMFNVKLCLIHSFFVECGCSHQHCSGLAWEEPIYLCPCIIVVGFYSHIIFFSFGRGVGGFRCCFVFVLAMATAIPVLRFTASGLIFVVVVVFFLSIITMCWTFFSSPGVCHPILKTLEPFMWVRASICCVVQ